MHLLGNLSTGDHFFIDKKATHIDTVERDEKKSQTPIVKYDTPSGKMFQILRSRF